MVLQGIRGSLSLFFSFFCAGLQEHGFLIAREKDTLRQRWDLSVPL